MDGRITQRASSQYVIVIMIDVRPSWLGDHVHLRTVGAMLTATYGGVAFGYTIALGDAMSLVSGFAMMVFAGIVAVWILPSAEAIAESWSDRSS